MCCSQHFTIYLLSLQNNYFLIDVVYHMLSCKSTCSIEIHLCTPLRLMTSPGCHSEKLSGFHLCIFQMILLTKMQFFFGSMWLLHCSWFFFSCKSLLGVNKMSLHSSCHKHYQRRETSIDLKNGFVICDALRDLVAFVQFKKREKHP